MPALTSGSHAGADLGKGYAGPGSHVPVHLARPLPPRGRHAGCNLQAGYYGPGSHVPCWMGMDGPPPPPPEPPWRGLRSASRALPWSARGPGLRRALALRWSPTAGRRRALCAAWAALSAPLRADLLVPWAQGVPRRTDGRALAWPPSAPQVRAALRLPWIIAPQRRNAVTLPWAGTQPRRRALHVPWHLAQRRHVSVRAPWQRAQPREVALQILWRMALARRSAATLPWGMSDGRLPWYIAPPPAPPPPPTPVGTLPGRIVGADLGCPAWLGPASHIPARLGEAACYNVRAAQRTYVVINEVSIIRLPDGLPIQAGSGSISASIDAWCAQMQFAPLTADDYAALQPTSAGPRSVQISINGHVEVFLVEDWTVDRSFAQHRFAVSGRSRSALLDAPYAPARSHAEPVTRTAAQLVDAELLDTGFTADWQTIDWTVPAGAWHYTDQTPIAAIVHAAAAVGAIVQTHPTDDELIIRPRYPASPWDWTVTSPDVTIPDDLIISMQGAVDSKPLYDAVYISAEAQGVQGIHRRTGSAGTEFAAQFSHPLISDALVLAEAGRNILSDRGGQVLWTMAQMPIFPAPILPGQLGRLRPLQLASVTDPAGNWLGQIQQVDLTWARDGARLTVHQTAVIARHPQDAN